MINEDTLSTYEPLIQKISKDHEARERFRSSLSSVGWGLVGTDNAAKPSPLSSPSPTVDANWNNVVNSYNNKTNNGNVTSPYSNNSAAIMWDGTDRLPLISSPNAAAYNGTSGAAEAFKPLNAKPSSPKKKGKKKKLQQQNATTTNTTTNTTTFDGKLKRTGNENTTLQILADSLSGQGQCQGQCQDQCQDQCIGQKIISFLLTLKLNCLKTL